MPNQTELAREHEALRAENEALRGENEALRGENEALRGENEDLRERLARLSEASLRINESLDYDRALQDVLDSACALTGARHGVLTLLDEAGRTQDFLASGLTAEQSAQLWGTPEGERIFAALTGLAAPLRLPDVMQHVRALGFSEFVLPVPVAGVYRFLGAPLRQRGRRLGHVFVGDKRGGGEFSRADEETLVMFASQAALVIANARRRRDERRARADLESLIDTSPVGVVMFDAQSGAPLSLNREARRLMDELRQPEQSLEQLLAALRYRRADGRRISVADYPLRRALSTGETVRAEEIVLEAPDGRRVSAIVNATPIRSEAGPVESVVVTLQDLAALEELDHLRAEFLAMVSHELRAPLSSIKGSAGTLIKSGLSLDPAAAAQFHQIIEQQAEQMEALITDLLDLARIASGELAVRPEPVALAALVDAARQSFLSGGARHDLEIELPPDLARVTADRRRLVQVLLNLLGNAARHSPAAGSIRLTAAQRDEQVQVTVADQGVGIAPERLPALFRAVSRRPTGGRTPPSETGFARPTETGLGLAICQGIIEAHGGRIWAESEGEGRGAQFHFTLPLAEAAAPPPEPGARARRPVRGRFRILVVDDDPQTLRYVRETLEEAGHEAITTGDPEAVRPLLGEHRPHLVLLDLMLPGTDGLALLEQLPDLRAQPVIFLSAYGGDELVARALELGADDYIAKPFSPTELVARIKTVLRRSALGAADEPEPAGPLSWGGLTIDDAERRVALDGRELALTPLEYRMLTELSRHAPRPLSNAELLPRVWGPAHPRRPGAVRTLIKQLRAKLGDQAERPTYVFNEPRAGYYMPEPDVEDAG